MKTILFYWSKGSQTRRSILRLIASCQSKNEPCYLSMLAEKLNLSHVAIKKHVDLIVEENYVAVANPGGKPAFLILTHKGSEMLSEISGS